LVAIGAAAVLAIYSAGYLRTKAAAAALDERDARRPIPPKAIEDALPVLSAPASTTGEPRSAVAGSGRPIAANAMSARLAPPAPPRPVTPQPEPTSTAVERAPGVPAPAPLVADARMVPASPTSAAAEPEPASADEAPRLKDGSYMGWGTSRHGNIQATVVIENGRIAKAFVSQCFTRYPCTWIEKLPPQVAERQSAEVDYVSGATESTNAFYFAVVEALGKAK
jgi:uncharacterized protein with FMN-binding domain